MGRTLVLSGPTRHGLVAIRQLGRAGVAVTGAGKSATSPSRFSRYTDRFVRYPDPQADAEGFEQAVAEELRDEEYELLLPIDGATVGPVIDARERFEPYATVPFPPTERFRIGYNKARTMAAAEAADVAHPTTVCPDAAGIDGVTDRLEFPMVVKPRWGRSRMGVSVCSDDAELVDAIIRTRSEHGPVIVQEFIPNGGERGVYTLYDWESTLSGVTVQQRLRSNHPDGGPSTLRETVSDPDLVAETDRLLSEIGWQGVAMAEYRIDPATDEAKLIEVNPRLWGSLKLTVAAGMNAPVMLYDLAATGDCDPALDYEVGVRAHWVLGDAMQILTRDDRLAAVGEFVDTVTDGTPRDVLSMNDPLPALSYSLGGLARNVT